jgi:Zn-dependent peptidase ImmA (M78 family)
MPNPTNLPDMLLARFKICRDVIHHYWNHLDGDADDGTVVVPNLVKIVELMTSKKVEEVRVNFAGRYIASEIVRWDDGALILVRADQDIPWIKFCTVKELCHLLCDSATEFQVDPIKSLDDLLQSEAATLVPSKSTIQIAEDLAEIMARELLYPSEYREKDAAYLTDGGSIAELAAKRQIPVKHLEHALHPAYREAVGALWQTLEAINEPVKSLICLSNEKLIS